MRYIILFLLSFNVYAVDIAGLNYTVYAAGGATPSMTTNRTVLASGVANTLNYDWGSGVVMNSGLSDGVLIHFTGYVLWPGATNTGLKNVTFYDRSDDGFYMTINGTTVINNWIEQGPANYNSSGSILLTSGQIYTMDVWYYENGGGAVIQLDWDIGGIAVVPFTNLGTSINVFVPPLCCGASSSPFTINVFDNANIQSYINRATSDSKVYIDQIGSANTITVNQTGTKNNYANYYGNGNSNSVNITQSSSNSTSTNYTTLNIIGNSNTASLTQSNEGGSKQVSANIIGNNSSLITNQSGNGNQYIETTLSGGNKNVDITQQGSGNHMANVTLSGLPVDLSLNQAGSLQQSYSINFNCATTGGCPKISVQQGQ